MRLMKRWLSGLLCLVLLLGLLPTAALAEGTTADWADPAVKVLKEIYGSDLGGSSSLDPMPKSQAAGVFTKMGNPEVAATLTGEGNLTRGEACTALVTAFAIPTGGKEAINYLFGQNIINGKSEDNLGKTDPVSFAEFAVLTYRVLNFVGGGKTENIDALKPGADGYFEWMYLAARKCVPFEIETNALQKKMSETTLTTLVWDENSGEGAWGEEEKTGENLWNAWVARLQSLLGEGCTFAPAYGEYVTAERTTLLEAAKTMVAEYVKMEGAAKTIFSDVVPGDYDNGGAYYDGVMYLFDQRILDGTGEGTFLMKDEYGVPKSTQRYELAVLLYQAHNPDEAIAGVARIKAAVDYVIGNKYMAGTKLTETTPGPGFNLEEWLGEYWAGDVTRQEAAVTILKFCEKEFSVDLGLTRINTAVLNRFTADVGQISGIGEGESSIASADEVKQYLAYGVSHGMISGKNAATLEPQGTLNRGELGVLLYRTLIGVDHTKMKDYGDSVEYAKEGSSVQTFALFAADPAPAPAQQEKALTLREDWRLTGELDLAVPEGTTLTIDGQGKYHIYEMGGTLQNSGLGKVEFKNTILYPSGSSTVCDTTTSNQLMMDRQPHKLTVNSMENGTVTTSATDEKAKKGDTVTLTVTSDSGYQLSTLTVTATEDGNSSVSVSGSGNTRTFTMPASDVTIAATFTAEGTPAAPAAPTFSPGSGTYSTAQSVTISCGTEGATIYYTTDGSDPTASSIQYTGAITISSSTTLKAIAVKDDVSSAVASATYTINTGGGSIGGGSGGTSGVNGSGDNVSISPSGGSVTSSQMESAVKKADEGSTITIKATSSTTVTLPVGGMAEAADNHNDIVVDLRSGEVVLSAQAVAGMTDGVSASSRVEVVITNQTNSKDETISDLMDKGAAVFDVSVEVDGKSIHSFNGDLTISFTVSNLSKISDPHILHILTDGSKEYYAPDSISGNTITVKGIRNLSTFAVIPGNEVPKEPANPFTDVYESDYYYDAVLWAVENGVTNGTSATTFSPDMAVSRAQMVTFLWRAHGSPKATGANPFTDVSTSDYYYDAVLWAVANGVTNGTSATTFSPDADVTRSQAVTFQWRASGSPVVSDSSFGDVASDAYYANAVTWAVANGITNGTGSNTFSPDVVVSRAQAVTFLYRELA